MGTFVLGTKIIAGEGTAWAEAQNSVFVARAHLLPPVAHDFLLGV